MDGENPSKPLEHTLVCRRKMTIPAENYFQAEYQGRVAYFCTEFCIDHFHRDPDRFFKAHSRGNCHEVS